MTVARVDALTSLELHPTPNTPKAGGLGVNSEDPLGNTIDGAIITLWYIYTSDIPHA